MNKHSRTHIQFAHSEIKPFLFELQSPTRAKLARLLDSLAQYGHELGMPYSKPVGSGIMELRVRGTQEVRLLYVLEDQKAVILHAFLKKTDRIPRRELETAMRRKAVLDGI